MDLMQITHETRLCMIELPQWFVAKEQPKILYTSMQEVFITSETVLSHKQSLKK